MSGSKWLELCKLDKQERDVGFSCTLYLRGLLDMKEFSDYDFAQLIKTFITLDEFNLNILRGVHETVKFCVPNNVSPRQLTKIMTKWLEQHPERLHISMTDSFYKSVKESFPLQKLKIKTG